MKILVTGCGGMLGSAMYPALREFGHEVWASDLIVDEAWLHPLDVRDHEAVERDIDTFGPDAVYHLAASTDLELCERHPEWAMDTNATATGAIAQMCAARHIPMVYISTAGVFDGHKAEPYDERDAAAPLMVYGETKLRGERLVRRHHDKHFIVRAGWMFGGGKKDHKFVSKIVSQLQQGSTTLYGVNDKWGTATYTVDFAANLELLVRSGAYGTYHMVCEGGATRYDVAAEIARALGYHDVPVLPVGSDHFEAEYFAPRPRSEMMVNRGLKLAGLNRMRPWREALGAYLQTTAGVGRAEGGVYRLRLREAMPMPVVDSLGV